jgi:uncharacterized membrane protein
MGMNGGGVNSETDVQNEPNKYASPEQLRYAKVLGIGVQLGFFMLVATFIIYLSGVLPPLVPVDQLPKYWGLSAAEFVKATHTPTGWSWLAQIGKGDVLNLLGICVLSSISVVSTLAVLPIFARRRERAHLIISILLIAVLVLSASNVLAAG